MGVVAVVALALVVGSSAVILVLSDGLVRLTWAGIVVFLVCLVGLAVAYLAAIGG